MEMDLFLQFGWGMMEHCRVLLEEWGGGTVVLSPRDLEKEQLPRFSKQLNESDSVSVLLDPQFYLPRCDHPRLQSHKYWPRDYDSGSYLHGEGLQALIMDLMKLNSDIGSQAIILPGLLCSVVDDLWLDFHTKCIQKASELGPDRQVFSTIALSAQVMADLDQIHRILEYAEEWEVDGYYVVFEHPKGEYISKEPIWLANILDFSAGLKLLGKQVVIGYCSHQMLICANSSVDAICSGTWMNVRSFPPEKFFAEYQEEIRRRSTWYYCPQLFSEYKIPFLDIALRLGVLDKIKPSNVFNSEYVEHLFSGVQPTTVGLQEPDAFRHYLLSLKTQATIIRKGSFQETAKGYLAQIDFAETELEALRKIGVKGQERDFFDALDVNKAALAVHQSTRGPMLERQWSKL